MAWHASHECWCLNSWGLITAGIPPLYRLSVGMFARWHAKTWQISRLAGFLKQLLQTKVDHAVTVYWSSRLMLVPSMGTAAIWQTKTAKPMPAGARIGRWAVLCALAWSVAANTTNTRRKVRMDSINHPALWGSPVRSTFDPPLAAWNPELSVCTMQDQ